MYQSEIVRIYYQMTIEQILVERQIALIRMDDGKVRMLDKILKEKDSE